MSFVYAQGVLMQQVAFSSLWSGRPMHVHTIVETHVVRGETVHIRPYDSCSVCFPTRVVFVVDKSDTTSDPPVFMLTSAVAPKARAYTEQESSLFVFETGSSETGSSEIARPDPDMEFYTNKAGTLVVAMTILALGHELEKAPEIGLEPWVVFSDDVPQITDSIQWSGGSEDGVGSEDPLVVYLGPMPWVYITPVLEQVMRAGLIGSYEDGTYTLPTGEVHLCRMYPDPHVERACLKTE